MGLGAFIFSAFWLISIGQVCHAARAASFLWLSFSGEFSLECMKQSRPVTHENIEVFGSRQPSMVIASSCTRVYFRPVAEWHSAALEHSPIGCVYFLHFLDGFEFSLIHPAPFRVRYESSSPLSYWGKTATILSHKSTFWALFASLTDLRKVWPFFHDFRNLG